MTTPATQALLPVTPEDREAAAQCMERDHRVVTAENMRSGQIDKNWLIQAFARHRQAHSLPGDVGMLTFLRECVEEARSDHVGYHESNKPGEPDTSKYDAALQHLAALTPSALSGDAGEGAFQAGFSAGFSEGMNEGMPGHKPVFCDDAWKAYVAGAGE